MQKPPRQELFGLAFGDLQRKVNCIRRRIVIGVLLANLLLRKKFNELLNILETKSICMINRTATFFSPILLFVLLSSKCDRSMKS